MHNAHGASTRSKQWTTFGGGTFPRTARYGGGARLWCSDGRSYIDWICGLGAISLGYGVLPGIEGYACSLSLEDEEETAAQLCEFLGWPEQVRWINSGSEATAGAMLIARRATGRRLIYSIGYHGWHETHLANSNLVIVDDETLYRDHEELDSSIGSSALPPAAAVIIECGRDRSACKQCLAGWRRWCSRTQTLLIADEVWAGLRLARGGWSERYGIRPDLACFSKALGNGVPVAAIVGRAALMQHAHDVSSTFGGNGLGLAAASAVMRVYEKGPVLERLNAIGERLLAQCPALLCGVPAKPHFRDAERSVAIVQHCAARGHLVHPTGITPMYAHTDADVESLIAALDEFRS